jgi:hypothetical protein
MLEMTMEVVHHVPMVVEAYQVAIAQAVQVVHHGKVVEVHRVGIQVTEVSQVAVDQVVVDQVVVDQVVVDQDLVVADQVVADQVVAGHEVEHRHDKAYVVAVDQVDQVDQVVVLEGDTEAGSDVGVEEEDDVVVDLVDQHDVQDLVAVFLQAFFE